MESKKEVEITKEELAQALTYYIAGKTGVSEETSAEEAGVRGTFSANIIEIAKEYAEEKISAEEVEKRVIEEAVTYSIAPLWDKIVDKGVDVAIKALDKVVPKRFKVIVEVLKVTEPFIKKALKSKLVKKSVELAHRAWSKAKVKAKEWLKKKLS